MCGRRVLLVGGTGFIGRRVLARLVDSGAEVTVLALFGPGEYDGPILSRCARLQGTIPSNQDAIAGTSWDTVIHLAGYIKQGLEREVATEMYASHLDELRLLVSLLPPSLRRFVHTGSAMEYGDNPVPHREDQRERPASPYAAAKVAATHFLQAEHRSRRFPAVVLRPFFVYGPGQDERKFVPWAIARARSGLTLEMTPGEQTRDPIHVDDVAEAYIRAALKDGVEGQVINVANGMPIRLSELARKIVEEVGRGQFALGVRPYRAGEVMRSEADIGCFRRLLGTWPMRSLDEGLKELTVSESAGGRSSVGAKMERT